MDKSVFCFPGWTRKAVSFTMDDGNVPLDKKFIDIVKPAGILGTFNLVSIDRMGDMTPEQYREFYKGYELTNHCKMHPKVMTAEDYASISDEPFDPNTSDRTKIYSAGREGVYHKFFRTWWGKVATEQAYIELVDESHRELEEIFGEGSIVAYVWPYCEQDSDAVKEHLRAAGYASVRRTGSVGFDLPTDRMSWSYNAIHTDLVSRAAEFEAIEDDGKLRFFCFGVHPHDFEYGNCWENLVEFAEKYGNRPGDFWYATVRDIFEYEDAVNAAAVTECGITNNSDKIVYAIVNGEKITVAPGETKEI